MSAARPPARPSLLLIGGGIGGMAAALALARLGMRIELLEQSARIGEIGAGLQLAPNAFAALDALGIGAEVRRSAVFTERLVLMDAVDCSEVASVPVGEAFRRRFGNPYAVTHRADLHEAILAAVQRHPLIRLHTSAHVRALELGADAVAARTTDFTPSQPTSPSARKTRPSVVRAATASASSSSALTCAEVCRRISGWRCTAAWIASCRSARCVTA